MIGVAPDLWDSSSTDTEDFAHGLSFDNLLDADNDLYKHYGIRQPSEYRLLDKDGYELKRPTEFFNAEDVEKALADLP